VSASRPLSDVAPLAPGSLAPPLEWREGDATVALAQRCREHGALVLFLPLAGAPVCREDVATLAAAASELGAPRRPLVVVSVDGDAHLRRFLDETGAAALRHHGDPTLAVARSFGVAREEGFTLRASFAIDRDGRVAASRVHPIAFPRPVELLREWVSALEAAGRSAAPPRPPAARA
jgi:peroxiredoxin